MIYFCKGHFIVLFLEENEFHGYVFLSLYEHWYVYHVTIDRYPRTYPDDAFSDPRGIHVQRSLDGSPSRGVHRHRHRGVAAGSLLQVQEWRIVRLLRWDVTVGASIAACGTWRRWSNNGRPRQWRYQGLAQDAEHFSYRYGNNNRSKRTKPYISASVVDSVFSHRIKQIQPQ